MSNYPSLTRIIRERDACRNTQNWDLTATRSAWWRQLSDLIEAIEDPEIGTADVERCRQAADDERFRLAERVARRLATTEAIALAVDGEGFDDDVFRAVDGADTVAEAVRIAREAGVKIDHGSNSMRRDGFVITADKACVFAACRSFDPDDSAWVEIDLLTGEVTRR